MKVRDLAAKTLQIKQREKCKWNCNKKDKETSQYRQKFCPRDIGNSLKNQQSIIEPKKKIIIINNQQSCEQNYQIWDIWCHQSNINVPFINLMVCNRLLRWLCSKESACLPSRRWGFDPWVRKIPWRREWQPTLVFLPGESHGQRSLAGYTVHGFARAGHNLVTK